MIDTGRLAGNGDVFLRRFQSSTTYAWLVPALDDEEGHLVYPRPAFGRTYRARGLVGKKFISCTITIRI
jgi:hypothetical protein